MNAIDFCFWLQGYFEIHGKTEVTAEQAAIIKNHLNLVFKHEIDPSYPAAEMLNVIHTPPDQLSHSDSSNFIARC